MNPNSYFACAILVLLLVTPCLGSFRFLKSLWSSASSTTTTSTTTIAPTLSSTELPVASGSLFESYAQHYPQLNESYLAELVSSNPNATNLEEIDQLGLPPELLDSFRQQLNLPNNDQLEHEDLVESNVTLPAVFEANSNISTYFGAGSGSGAVSSSGNQDNKKPTPEEEKPFEVLIQNDKTMAHLKFDHSGRDLVTCALYDIEKDPSSLSTVPEETKLRPPLLADYKTMLEAIRRCTELARRQLETSGVLPARRVALNETSTASSNVSSVAVQLVSATTQAPNISLASSSSINFASASGNLSVVGSNNVPPAGGSPNGGIKNMWDNSNFISVWKGIMPGTKWCGLGDSALHYNDLGAKADVDLCCRAHDHCPIRLKAFRMAYGLINFSFYTKSHCDCDEDFFKCLKQSSNSYASVLGNFYFNVLKVQCLKQESPFVCIRKRTTTNRKEECVQYDVTSKAKMKSVPFQYYFR